MSLDRARGGTHRRQRGDAPDRPGLEPPPGNPKFPHLDGIRGIACLAILGFHGLGGTVTTAGAPWVHFAATLRLALPFFFFLSAFLLYRPFVATRVGASPRPPLRTFWWRRVLRIVPAYWVALTLAAVVVGLPGVFGPRGWTYYTFVYIYRQHTVAGGLEPAWTLCVDMTFYLLLPFFAYAMDRVWARVGASRAVPLELGVLAGIWLLSTIYWLVFVSGVSLTPAALYVREWNLAANLNWFALGMILAVLSVSDLRAPGLLTRALSLRHGVTISWLCSLLLFILVAGFYFSLSETALHLLASVMCFGIFAPAVLVGRRGGVQRVLAHPRVAWLGVVSYGIYLYHGPVLNELTREGIKLGTRGFGAYVSLVLIAVPIAVALSIASYYLLERPLLRHKTRRAPGGLSAAGAGTAESAQAAMLDPARVELS